MDTTLKNRPMLLASEGRDITSLSEDMVWDALNAHGTVLFRDFHIDVNGFYRFASHFTRGFLISPFDDRVRVNDTNELQTVTIGHAALGPHFEYGNMPIRPDLIWFYCRKAPAEGTGGETVVVDGTAIFDCLKQPTRDLLRARRIKYTNFVPRSAFDAMLGANKVIGDLIGPDVIGSLGVTCHFSITENTDQRVVSEFIAPSILPVADTGEMAICQNIGTTAYKKPGDAQAEGSFSTLVTWEDGSEIEHEVLEDIGRATRSLSRGIRWRDGDFAMIDNNRILHGRNRTSDPLRDIVMLSSFSTRFGTGQRSG